MPGPGELIRTARESREWSKGELSRRSGVDRPMISRIEAGQKTGSVSTIVALFGALGIDLNLLKDETSLDDSPTVSP